MQLSQAITVTFHTAFIIHLTQVHVLYLAELLKVQEAQLLLGWPTVLPQS